MSTNNLTITPTLSSINAQHISSAQNNIAGTPAVQTPIQQQPATENSNSKESVQETQNNTKKIIITAGVALAALAGIYALVKSGKGKEKVRETAQNAVAETAQNNKTVEAAAEKIQEVAGGIPIATTADKGSEAVTDKIAEATVETTQGNKTAKTKVADKKKKTGRSTNKTTTRRTQEKAIRGREQVGTTQEIKVAKVEAEKIQEVAGEKPIATAADKVGETAEAELDKLNYEIKKPKISDLTNDSDFMEHVDDEFPLQLQYNKVLYDIKRDKNTLKRYNEVEQILKDASSEIANKFQTIDNEVNSAVDKMDGLDEFTKELLRDSSKYFGVCTERAISQKRYFSMPGNQQEGYCCKDPLLSKEARAEIIDTYLGYDLLSPLRGSSGVKESPLLNALRNKYTISNDADNKFIDECISRMTSNPESSASGRNSSFHAHELAHLGKIFREAMGVIVK